MRLRTLSLLILLFTRALSAEVTPQNPLSYKNCLEIFDSSEIPSAASTVLGAWRRVGVAMAKPSNFLVPVSNFDSAGIKNPDGTIKKLDFEKASDPKLKPTVQLHLGAGAAFQQGPYLFRPGAKGITFSQWGYRNGLVAQSEYVSYTCRKGESGRPSLVCLLEVYFTDSNKLFPNSQVCELYYMDALWPLEPVAPTI